MNLNKVILIGNLAAYPEHKVLANGTDGSPGSHVTTFRLATTTRKAKDGQVSEETEYHSIVAWGKLAESCARLTVGALLAVEGKLRTRTWEKDGIKQYKTEIVAERVEFGPRIEKIERDEESGQELSDEEMPF